MEELTDKKLEEAEKLIYKRLQKAHFPAELKAAKSNEIQKPNGRWEQKIAQGSEN